MLESLKIQLENINIKIQSESTLEDKKENYDKVLSKYNYIDKLTTEVVNDFIKTISIGEYHGKKRDVEIQWAFCMV